MVRRSGFLVSGFLIFIFFAAFAAGLKAGDAKTFSVVKTEMKEDKEREEVQKQDEIAV